MSEKMTVIAIDDEPKALEVISLHVQRTPFLELVETFRDAVDALSWLQHQSVDLIFLDINMPHLSGLKFRELLGEQSLIVFTTAYTEYAVESYNFNAVDYLLKPILFDRFLKAALRAKELQALRTGHHMKNTEKETPAIAATQHYIYVKSGTKLHKVATSEILYLEKEGNYVSFHLLNRKKILSRLNVSQLQELLPDKGFIRVHKSYIIALAHVDILETHQVHIAGVKIPVTKAYRDQLLENF